MRSLICFLLALIIWQINFAQVQIVDSVQLNTVSIEANIVQQDPQQQQVDSMDLQAPIYKDLGESLQQNANLFIKSYGMGSMASISLRGTNSAQTKLYWNDISLNSPTYGSTDLSLFPTFFIDEAAVDYGLSSLQYGSGGLGGAVRLSSNANFNSKKELSISQDIGSFGHSTTTIKAKLGTAKWQAESKLFYRSAEQDFSYQNRAKESFPEEQVQNAGLLQRGFMQSLHYRIKQHSRLNAHYWFYESDRNLPPLMTGTAFQESQVDRSHRFLLEYLHYFKKSVLEVKASHLNDYLSYTNERSNTFSESSMRAFKFVAKLEHEWNSKWKWNSRLNGDLYQLQDQVNLAESERQELSSFHALEFSPSKKLKSYAQVRQLLIDQEQNYWMPKFGLTYSPDSAKNLSFGFNVGQNVKYPTLNDLNLRPGGNQDLEPETSENIELSLSKLWILNKASLVDLRAAVYQANIENFILWQPSIFGYWEARNIRAVQTRGVEIRVKVEHQFNAFNLLLEGNYTHSSSIKADRSYPGDASKGKQLIYIPEHQYNLHAAIRFNSYQISYRNQFVGARYTSTDNQHFLPFYNLSDLSLSKSVQWKAQKVQLSISAMNLFDQEYQAIQWRPMPGRNYMLRINWRISS